jgi:phage-related minor tail protein
VRGRKRDFGEVASAWADTLMQMAIQTAIFRPIFSSLGGLFASPTPGSDGGSSGGTSPIAFVDRYGGERAEGGPVEYGKTYLVGEQGPELFKPPSSGTILPNHALRSGGSAPIVQIFDYRSSGSQVETSSSTGPDGRQVISVMIRDEVRKQVASGALDSVFAQTYGSSRRGRR